MTDDLVKRWDEYVESMGCVMGEVEHMAQQMRGRIDAQAAEIERLRGALQWCSGSADFNEGGIAREGWLKLCAPLLTKGATVKDYLTTEDEKQSHEWKCPIDYPGCRKNCGSYGCGN